MPRLKYELPAIVNIIGFLTYYIVPEWSRRKLQGSSSSEHDTDGTEIRVSVEDRDPTNVSIQTILNFGQAEKEGLLRPHSGDAIYEGTSGSTGISLATLARAKGYLAHMYVSSIDRASFLQT